MSTHTEDLKFRMATVELLKIAKKNYTYRNLSTKTELPVTVLSRYVKGHVLPSTNRARNLWESLSKIVILKSEFRKRIKFNKKGFFDNTFIISDIALLNQAANYALSKFAGKRITKVLAAAVDGIPLATMVSNALGVNLMIAKTHKEVGVTSFIEETFILESSGHTITLYLPKKIIKKHDSVLIVDDVIKSGETQSALVRLTGKAKAEVSGLFAMIAIGKEWMQKLHIPRNCQLEIVLNIN